MSDVYKSIAIIAVAIVIGLKLLKVTDLISWSVVNFLHGRGFTDIDWPVKMFKWLPKISIWINKTKRTWIYKILDIIF